MSRNLKKFAGCGARPAIQYVLEYTHACQHLCCGKTKAKGYSHGSHDDGGDYAERDDIEEEANEQPSGWTIRGHTKKTCEDQICMTNPGMNKQTCNTRSSVRVQTVGASQAHCVTR